MESYWLAITAISTSIAAFAVLLRALQRGLAAWHKRPSWGNMSVYERDIVWAMRASGFLDVFLDYGRKFATPDRPMAFVKEGVLALRDAPLAGYSPHFYPGYVVHLEAMQDKDLMRPHSEVLLELQPDHFIARPRLLQRLDAWHDAVSRHEAVALPRINYRSQDASS